MSHDYLGEHVADYELGFASLRECQRTALAEVVDGCPRCGQRHRSDVERANCSLMEDQSEPAIPHDFPRDVRTCQCGHVDDAEYGETCVDCHTWMCGRCAPSRPAVQIRCFACGCRVQREMFKAGRTL